ncbi:MAG: divalent-cation tolerance protein CutA [Gallionellaceae bacterium]|nr:divalent-cation tolerance protein CutA [Gallionellaceae bacterium]
MSSDILLVISNFPDHACATTAAEALVEAKLAACVNILPACTSIYRWEGKIEHANEVPLLIKTTRAAYPQLESALRELHPYELPEIIAVSVAAGLPAYLNWVAQETQTKD